MARIGEAGTQDPFVSGDDGSAAILGFDVGDEGEPGGGAILGCGG